MARTAFGFERTSCACAECTLNCKIMPGYLVPDDLFPLFKNYNPTNISFSDWTREYLRASPGALVGTAIGLLRIHTLVPARRADGACIFLDEQDRCKVHEVSPYGCAMFSAHQSTKESDSRSKAGLLDILGDRHRNGPYAQLWDILWNSGKKSPPPEDLRRKFDQLARLKE